MTQVTYITKEGLQKLKNELDQLVNIERPSISKQIAEARDKGDLSENAEYAAAKESQAMLELRINKLREIIMYSRLVDESKIDSSSIQLLSKVKIKNLKNNQVMEYTLVSESEADLKTGKISSGSPIAKGLIGKATGDIVEITVPSGTVKFEVLSISR